MKNTILITTIALFLTLSSTAQSTDEGAIKETIVSFSKAGDMNDANKLATYLDDNYRIVMNRLFGSPEVSVMTKDVYLEKIRTKEYGGDDRKLVFESIVLNGSTASAKVSFIGSNMTFVSMLTLIKNGENEWKLVGDVPVVK